MNLSVTCASSLTSVEVVKYSPIGKGVGLLLDGIEAVKVTETAILPISKASCYITAGYRHKLPSAV